MKKQQGTTLIELMITLAVATIILTIAIPSFHETITRNRLTAVNNSFITAINYARSEAIKRGQNVTLCKSSSGTACTTTGTQWENGWIVFLDKNANGALDTGEEKLRAWANLQSGYTIRPNNNFSNYLRYNARGEANNIGTFAVCHDNQIVGAKAIIISRLRPRLGIDTNNNRIPEKDTGSDIISCADP